MKSLKKLCESCKAKCCNGTKFNSVVIYPGEVDELRALGAKIEKQPGFSTLLMSQEGGCKFLVNGRCSIYKQRPTSCKTYDCRILCRNVND
jgi:Fe-S-cluster containining protein